MQGACVRILCLEPLRRLSTHDRLCQDAKLTREPSTSPAIASLPRQGTLLETAAAAEAAVAEVAKSRLVRWQERHYMLLSLGMGLALPLLIAGLGWGDWTGALRCV